MVRKIRAKVVLELQSQGLSGRAIAASQGMSRKSVSQVLEAAAREQVVWQDVHEKTDDQVYELLFPERNEQVSVYEQPDWIVVHKELARVGVTLKLLHQEYKDRCAVAGLPAMGYDRFCKTYQHHVLVSGAASRVSHKAGQTVEVDWSGPTMTLLDPVTGVTSKVYLFVACLPFSRYAFVEPCLDMRQDTWLQAHVSMYEFFGGSVPRLVPDNLKTGVISHPRDGEIVLNNAYRQMAAHYSAAVLPARVRAPKDKASAENTVAHVATWVIAALREQSFATLGDLRAAIRGQMDAYNREPFQKRVGSRATIFESEERPFLRPLPAVAFETSTWVYGRKVARNSHVVWKKNFYSVTYTYIGTTVDLRVTATSLEVFAGTTRISSHLLVGHGQVNRYQTHDHDIPEGKQFKEWDGARVRQWAGRIGPSTVLGVDRIFASVPFEEQGLNAALAVLRLGKKHSNQRLEAACALALATTIHSPRYSHLSPILISSQDKIGSPTMVTQEPQGGYVRGASYYAGGN